MTSSYVMASLRSFSSMVYTVRGRMGTFIQNYLSHRQFRVRRFKPLLTRERGPPGGVLSVALFAVMINDIGDALPAGVGRSLFVDDLAIGYSASSTRSVSRQLQLAVSRLERWGAENGLRFSTTQTVAVHLCRRRCSDLDLWIRLYRQPVPTQPVAKFLGVLF